MAREFLSRLVNKHDTEANWKKATNFKPLLGELIIYDADSSYNYPRLKVGDGTTIVSDLPFISDFDTINTAITDAIAELAWSGLDLKPNETIDIIKQSNGVISGSKQNIAITMSQITDLEFPEIPEAPGISASASDDGVVNITLTATYDTAENKYKITATAALEKLDSPYTSSNTIESIGPGESKTIKLPQFTVDEWGRVTVASDENIAITIPKIPDSVNTAIQSVTATGDGMVNLSATKSGTSIAITGSHEKTGVDYLSQNTTTKISGAGTTATIKIPQFETDEYGHITSASDEDIVITLPTQPTIPNLNVNSPTKDTADSLSYGETFTVVTGVNASGHTITPITTTFTLPESDNTDTNTAHAHSAGVGLTASGTGGIDGTTTYKAKLKSETALTLDSAAVTTTSGRVYPVAVDKSGYLAVNVPWQDTNATYSAGSGLKLTGTTFNHENSITEKTTTSNTTKTLTYGGSFVIDEVKYDTEGHITGVTTSTITLPAAPTIPSLSDGGVKDSGTAESLTHGETFTVLTDVDVSGHTVTPRSTKFTLPGETGITVGTASTGTDTLAHGGKLAVITNVSADGHTVTPTVTTFTMPSETSLKDGGLTASGTKESLSHGETFTVVTDVDVSGHTVTPKTTEFTLPSETSLKDGGVSSVGTGTLTHGGTVTVLTDVDVSGHTVTPRSKTFTLPSETSLQDGGVVDSGTTESLSHGETFTVLTDVDVSGHTVTPRSTKFTLPIVEVSNGDPTNDTDKTYTYVESLAKDGSGNVTTVRKKFTTKTAYSTNNPLATIDDITTAISDLATIMRFRGVSTTNPGTGTVTISGKVLTPTSGDVVIYESDNTEWIYDGSNWIELGDEDNWYDAGSGLKLTGNVFNHENSIVERTAYLNNSKTLSPNYTGTFKIPDIKYDTEGHITEVQDVTITMPSQQNIKVDGVSSSSTITRYCTCSTAAATVAKTASVTSGTFSLETGAQVTVKFTYANTAASPTLNINSTGAKNIFYKGAALTLQDYWVAGEVITFAYDGTRWNIIGHGDTYSPGNGISITNGEIGHSNDPVTEKTTTSNTTKTLPYGGSFVVDEVKYDKLGHITGVTTSTITLPNAQTIPTLVDGGLSATGTTEALSYGETFTVVTDIDVSGHTVTPRTTKFTIPASDNTDTNTSHAHSAGVGLVGSGNAGTSGGTYTYKAKLKSETALTLDSAAATTTSGRIYPVAVDKSGYLATNVPWIAYSAGTGLKLTGNTFDHENVIAEKTAYHNSSTSKTGSVVICETKWDTEGHITGHQDVTFTESNDYGKIVTPSGTVEANARHDTLTFTQSGDAVVTATASSDTINIHSTPYTPGSGLKLTGHTFDHENSITARSAYLNSSTSISGNGKSFKIPDIQYDTEGHITKIQDITVTMPTDTDIKATTTLTITSGEYPLILKNTTTTTDSPTTTLRYGAGITANPSTKTLKLLSGTAYTILKPNNIDMTEDGTNIVNITTTANTLHSSAKTFNFGGSANMTYNSTDKCITFSFI